MTMGFRSQRGKSPPVMTCGGVALCTCPGASAASKPLTHDGYGVLDWLRRGRVSLTI
jgi:hypothetical protein